MTNPSKTDNLIWWLMVTFCGIIIIGGSAWANSINAKVEKIASMEVNIQFIQSDVKDIKDIIKVAIKGLANNKGSND